jgi:hypothetical protein
MDRKTFSIVMAVALIVGFFLPLLKIGGSAFDVVKAGGTWENYLWVIIPICGALLLLGELNNKYVTSRGLLTWLPLLTILVCLIIVPLINKASLDFGKLIKVFGVGMWVMLVASILLAFYNPKPR